MARTLGTVLQTNQGIRVVIAEGIGIMFMVCIGRQDSNNCRNYCTTALTLQNVVHVVPKIVKILANTAALCENPSSIIIYIQRERERVCE